MSKRPDDWNLRVPMLSINPDAGDRDDIAWLAADLMEARRVLQMFVAWDDYGGDAPEMLRDAVAEARKEIGAKL